MSNIYSRLSLYLCLRYILDFLRYLFFLYPFNILRFRLAFLGSGSTIHAPNLLYLGTYTRIGNHINMIGRDFLFVRIGNYSSIGDYTRIHLSNLAYMRKAFLIIGDNSHLSSFSSLGCAGGITIGNDCIFGEGFYAHSENHLFDDLNIPIRLQGVSQKGIVIGDDCWFGSRVTVVDGVSIGKGCVVGASSVVTKSFGDYSVIAGNPARLLRTRK